MKNYFINLDYSNQLSFNMQVPYLQLVDAVKIWAPEISAKITGLEKQQGFDLIIEIERLFYKIDLAHQMVSSVYNFNQIPEISEVLDQVQAIKIELFSELTNNENIFNNLKAIELSSLSSSNKKLVADWLLGFKLGGCGLSSESQKRLMSIDQEVTSLELKYTEILTQENYRTFDYVLADCNGVPASILDDAEKVNGIVKFNDNHSSDIIAYSHNNHLRETAYKHSKTIGKTAEVDSIILKLNHLRQEKAKLLGYKSYVDYSLDQKMVKNLINLNSMITPLYEKVKPLAIKKFNEIESFAKSQGCENVGPWDVPYYSNLLTNKKFSLDDQIIKKHFPFKKVWSGLLEFIHQKWNLTFKYESQNPYNSLYSVFQGTNYLGQVVLDPYSRENKMNGAWMDSYVLGGFEQKPIVFLSCNFNESDLFLSLSDINTLFHETGHVLHGLLNHSIYPSQHGTNVVEDFIEFPSQFMENWVLEPEVLSLISDSTNLDPLPENFTNLVKQFQYDNITTWILGQFYYLNLDLKFHEKKFVSTADIKQMEYDLYSETYDHKPASDQFHVLNNFGHVIESSYAAGYFSYLWASILEKDAFIYMKSQPTDLWEKVLVCYQSAGRDELEVYKEFREGVPSAENFLKAYLVE